MRETAKALKEFVGSFDLPAYTIDTVPDDVKLPYLVYSLNEPEWNQKATFYIQGWYRTKSNAVLLEKADEIVQAIGEGLKIKTVNGYVMIYPESPLIQLITNGDTRSFYINLSLNSYHLPGT